ncbi:TaqI-like C-terminal specificity domain-containing protein [Amycolatopsis panacis]|uniref:TaqI-like C-terminal specificity domain-containing protein n=1 Tax=Amycolatopsis panacis TaxID=2340917 RepID=UPI0018F5FDA2|nr:TaqI-like C-terminal specificity domain-containing protein [Amycolatopsis panacis]
MSLDDYPLLKKYFSRHSQLRKRHIAQKSSSVWYRTIDKVRAEVVNQPKLLLQDMRSKINPVLEPGGYYPHHNLYYLVSDKWDLEVLGGLLLSRIAQAFVEAYSVRMRGGTLRFQAQYLKQIRVPDPDAIGVKLSNSLKRAFRARDIEAATSAAASAYGIDLVEYELEV